jgi:hypothetical protein
VVSTSVKATLLATARGRLETNATVGRAIGPYPRGVYCHTLGGYARFAATESVHQTKALVKIGSRSRLLLVGVNFAIGPRSAVSANEVMAARAVDHRHDGRWWPLGVSPCHATTGHSGR